MRFIRNETLYTMNWGYAFPDEQHEQQQQHHQQQSQFGYRFGGGDSGHSGAAFDGPDVTLSNPPPLNLRHPYDDGAFDDAIMDPSLMLFGDQQFDGISPTSLGSATSLLACSPMNRNNAVAVGVTADVPKQEVAIASTAASASTSAGGDSKKKKANDSKAKPKFNTFKEKSDVALQRENDAKIRFDQVRLVRSLWYRVLFCVFSFVHSFLSQRDSTTTKSFTCCNIYV